MWLKHDRRRYRMAVIGGDGKPLIDGEYVWDLAFSGASGAWVWHIGTTLGGSRMEINVARREAVGDGRGR